MATKKQTGSKSRSTKKGPVKKAVETVGDVVGNVADAVMSIPGKLAPKKKTTTRKSSNSSSSSSGKKTSSGKSTGKKGGTRKKATQSS